MVVKSVIYTLNCINPLTSKSDQHSISPYIITPKWDFPTWELRKWCPLENFLTVEQIFQGSNREYIKETVWRIYILMSGYKEFGNFLLFG